MTVTLINAFSVPPEQDEAFVKSWKQVAGVLSAKPGYVDARLHRAIDAQARFRFVNVAHWESQEAYAAAMEAFPSAIAEVEGVEPNPALYVPVAGDPQVPTITEADIFTQIVEFEVAPERQHDLIAALAAEVERWVRHRPGFLSASFHASHDGKRVFNYAQWRTEADFRAFVADPNGEHIASAVRGIGGVTGPRATHCRVVRVVSPPRNETASNKEEKNNG
jgi:heme-degrading monooxygenase HmoA